MAEKAADVVYLLVKASTFFATPTSAGRVNVMELRLTTFKTAMHRKAWKVKLPHCFVGRAVLTGVCSMLLKTIQTLSLKKIDFKKWSSVDLYYFKYHGMVSL